MAQAVSNYEKNRTKILLYCPLKRIRKSHMTPHSMILHGTWLRAVEKLEYLSENKTKKENIFTHWSVAQAGLNDEYKVYM